MKPTLKQLGLELEVRTPSLEEVVDLNRLTAICFGKEVPLDETHERCGEADKIFLLKKNGEIVGYAFNNSMKLNGYNIHYFGSAFVKPELQGGVYHLLNEERIKAIESDIIMARTQNPKIYSGFQRLGREFGYTMSQDAKGVTKDLGLRVARAYSPDCTSRQICKGVYGRELMANTPKALGDTAVIFENIDTKAGDAIILVGIRHY